MRDVYDMKIANPICKAHWVGDSNVLPIGSVVDVLAVDAYPHMVEGEVPARQSVWIRCTNFGRACYRSCDVCDLEVIEDENG